VRRLLAACLVAAEVAVAARADAAATVRAVREILTPATTRLIVECSAPVQHHLRNVPAQPRLGVPQRVYVDLIGARLDEATPLPAAFREGPVVRLRAAQNGPASTRLILDVPGLSASGVFAMPDPFRLIIDVRGAPRVAPPAETVASARAAGVRAAGAPAEAPVPTAMRRAEQPNPAASLPRRRFKIVVDPGHGGKDPGALGVGGLAEKDVVLAIAQRLQARLAGVPDVDVILTRDSDVFLALEERTARANAAQADLFISVHANASTDPSLSGVETYYLNNANDRATIRLAEMENGLRTVTGRGGRDRNASFILSDLIQSYKVQESVALAEDVQRGLVGALDAHGTPAPDLGVKRGPFYVLVGAGMPCVLVEAAFITHPTEGRRLAQASYQDILAEGLLRGIQRFVENARLAGNL